MPIDVCLLSPASRANEPFLPFGLLYVGSYARKQGLDVRIVDVKATPFSALSQEARRKAEAETLDRIEDLHPAVVGMTCLVTEVNEVMNLSRRIKSRVKEVSIVVGGIHPTMYPGDFLQQYGPVDYVVIGEGEETLAQLATTIIDSGSVQDVESIAWWDNGQVGRSPFRPPIQDLDEIPFPLYDDIDADYYFRPNIYVIRNMFLSTAQLFTSRGCPFQCTFCVNKNLKNIMGTTKPIRYRSANNVIDEIEYLVDRYFIDGIYISDDTFCVNKKFVFDFCQELSKRNLELTWATETRVNLISRDMLESMRDAGCVQLDFGVESGSPEILKRIKKGITVEQARDAFRLCHEVGIRPLANFMFNTPGETENDVQQTLALARDLDACYYNFSIMVPYPGTDIYEDVEPKLAVDEYHLLYNAKKTVTIPRFRFARHDRNLDKLTWGSHLSFNSLRRRIAFVFNRRYLVQLLKSRRKLDYLLTLLALGGRIVMYYVESLEFFLKHFRFKSENRT